MTAEHSLVQEQAMVYADYDAWWLRRHAESTTLRTRMDMELTHVTDEQHLLLCDTYERILKSIVDETTFFPDIYSDGLYHFLVHGNVRAGGTVYDVVWESEKVNEGTAFIDYDTQTIHAGFSMPDIGIVLSSLIRGQLPEHFEIIAHESSHGNSVHQRVGRTSDETHLAMEEMVCLQTTPCLFELSSTRIMETMIRRYRFSDLLEDIRWQFYPQRSGMGSPTWWNDMLNEAMTDTGFNVSAIDSRLRAVWENSDPVIMEQLHDIIGRHEPSVLHFGDKVRSTYAMIPSLRALGYTMEDLISLSNDPGDWLTPEQIRTDPDLSPLMRVTGVTFSYGVYKKVAYAIVASLAEHNMTGRELTALISLHKKHSQAIRCHAASIALEELTHVIQIVHTSPNGYA